MGVEIASSGTLVLPMMYPTPTRRDLCYFRPPTRGPSLPGLIPAAYNCQREFIFLLFAVLGVKRLQRYGIAGGCYLFVPCFFNLEEAKRLVINFHLGQPNYKTLVSTY